MKVSVSHKRNFTEWGGLIPIVNELYKLGIPDLFDAAFEKDKPRVRQSKYKFSDVFTALIASTLCGGVRIDNITGLKKELELIPGLNIPSHDTVGRLMKKMAMPEMIKDVYGNHSLRTNYYDDNLRLNKLLIQTSKKMGCFEEGEEYILDADCTFISTLCAGAKSAKGVDKYGFFPLVCLIGNMPIFISNRNGNSSDEFRLSETIEQCLDILDEEGIKIKAVRMDGAGYHKKLVEMLEDRGVKFLFGAPVHPTFKTMWKGLDKTTWRETTIETANEFRECQISETSYSMFESDYSFRIVGVRTPTTQSVRDSEDEEEKEFRNTQTEKMKELKEKGVLKSKNKRYIFSEWKKKSNYRYKLIITNDFDSPLEDIVRNYNMRGDAERQFSFMKQDFGWKWPPFQNMNENSVFFILTSMANNIYRATLKKNIEHLPELELNARVGRFRKNFIKVICYFIADDEIHFEGTNIDFEKIC